MPEYRLITESGDVVQTATHEHDQAAVAWRSAHPFEGASQADDSRQLRIERQDGEEWVRLPATLGTADSS
ncbi:hypothetical protein ACHAAC_05355 [Aeromicrobium sp. CF4.19]|uniref:hypothetical protein n=1 Tax=Aeromicrobium sp. CF4.19 TaxID=3373082 RepID=UPI003EE6F6C9